MKNMHFLCSTLYNKRIFNMGEHITLLGMGHTCVYTIQH